MEWHKDINRELKNKYGTDSIGQVQYRVIQNLNLTEKRNVEKWAMLHGGIPVKSWEIEDHPKYNYLEKGVWILEKLFYVQMEELGNRYSYEPLWVFKPGQNPNLKACVFVIECSLKGPETVLSEYDQENKEVEMFYDMLGGNFSPADAIAAGEGIVVPSNYEKGSNNG